MPEADRKEGLERHYKIADSFSTAPNEGIDFKAHPYQIHSLHTKMA